MRQISRYAKHAGSGAHRLLGSSSATTAHDYAKGRELLAETASDNRIDLEIGDVETLRIYAKTCATLARSTSRPMTPH